MGNHFRGDTLQQHHRLCHRAVCHADRQHGPHSQIRLGSDDCRQPLLEPTGLFLAAQQKYVILGVTGPDEYENNVDNNWYTNYSCIQCSQDDAPLEVIALQYPSEYAHVCRITNFNQTEECRQWQETSAGCICRKMRNGRYLRPKRRLHGQGAGKHRPYPRRRASHQPALVGTASCAPVTSSKAMFCSGFTSITSISIRRPYAATSEFYEPMTVHESSLSPHIHAILAARIGEVEKAYRLFMHATRLDLDDYNNEAESRVAHHQHARPMACHRTRLCRHADTERGTGILSRLAA